MTTRTLDRRRFLRTAAATAGAVTALPAFRGLGLLGLEGRVFAAPPGGYGPLNPVADLRDGAMRIALPAGFQYRSFSHAGEMMSDGHLVPLAHDGMAVFNMKSGRFRLVRNHEDRNAPGAGSTPTDGNAYDPLAGGGTTTLVVNPFTRELERDFISLNGTIVNCAGGWTPWGTWLTCEETNAGPPAWPKQHGYCFDVPAAADASVPAIALPDLGRFSHEACAVDPDTWIVYETEDNGSTSGLYRFLPNAPGVLADGGRLQMLAVEGMPNYPAHTGQTVGMALPVTWVDIADPDPPRSATPSTDVFRQGAALGAASFARLEGCWWGSGALYFAATSGGDAGLGQVWEYRPKGDSGTLTLIFESGGPTQLDSPDNVAVSPGGALMLCEDGDADQYLRGLTVDGEIFDFSLNLETDHEWAGATFAVADPRWNDSKIRGQHRPLGSREDRTTLFVNRQGATRGPNPPAPGAEGMTFAIWGPWQKGAL